MTEPTQILIFAVIIILTILMVIIGWQIYLILSEIRKALVKMNKTVDNVSDFAENIGRSFQNFSGFSEGIKAVFGVFKLFKKGEKDDGERKK
jgi:hypothetical protein